MLGEKNKEGIKTETGIDMSLQPSKSEFWQKAVSWMFTSLER